MSIENPTLANFRHFSSLLTNFPSTLVESALQIHLFLQNEPNFRKSQMNINKVLTRDYEKRTLGGVGKTNPKRTQSNPILGQKLQKRTPNKPQTNPNKANFIGKNSWFLWLLFGSGQAGQASRFYCLWEIGVYLSLVIS